MGSPRSSEVWMAISSLYLVLLLLLFPFQLLWPPYYSSTPPMPPNPSGVIAATPKLVLTVYRRHKVDAHWLYNTSWLLLLSKLSSSLSLKCPSMATILFFLFKKNSIWLLTEFSPLVPTAHCRLIHNMSAKLQTQVWNIQVSFFSLHWIRNADWTEGFGDRCVEGMN